ncbi:MAG: hypothetical protein N2D54_02655 [Chloroflexota bacterium]
MQSTLEFTETLAKKTGDLLMSYYHPEGIKSTLKPDKTVVTEADLAADEFISMGISENYPQELILSEEANTITDGDKSTVWIIDPLDGTNNFSQGLAIWGVSIARVVNGYPETAALYFPVVNELYSAQKNVGAFYNQTQIKLNSKNKRPETGIFTCCTRTLKYYKTSIPYTTRIWGSTTYDMCNVARGTVAIGFQATPKIWDIAAGWLVLQEAGAQVSVLAGPDPFPLKPSQDYDKFDFPIYMTINQTLSDMAQKNIKNNKALSGAI